MTAPAPLRPLERHSPPGEHRGRVALFDPLGVAPEASGRAVLLEAAAWEIARRFDGKTEAEQLAREAGLALGRTLEAAQVEQLAERLSKGLFLADGRFEAAAARAFEAFRRESRRAARGAGRDYPADAFELRLRIGGAVADDWDMPPLFSAQGLWAPSSALDAAGPLFARAFASVRHLRGSLARVVVLANAGAPFPEPLIPLAKAFELPLGAVECDTEALSALGMLPGRSQLAHGPNLAIERALLFVRVLFPGVPALALLASSLDGPGAEERAGEAALALGRVLDLPGRTLLVAAADLVRLGPGPGAAAQGSPAEAAPAPSELRPGRGASHPGQRPPSIGGALGSELRAKDSEAQDLAARLDWRGFWEWALAEGDPARAAAAAAPYHLLRALCGRPSLAPEEDGPTHVRGSALGYLQMAQPGQLATATAVVFH